MSHSDTSQEGKERKRAKLRMTPQIDRQVVGRLAAVAAAVVVARHNTKLSKQNLNLNLNIKKQTQKL